MDFERIIDNFYIQNKLVGLSVSLITAQREKVFIDKGVKELNGATVTPNSIFPIASIAKIFTGLLLAKMVTLGRVEYQTPIKELLPKEIGYTGDITLWHLATHTSGLPRLPDNIKPKDLNNPYADYHQVDLYQFLSNYKEDNNPGQDFLYSNLGFAILGHVLAIKNGGSFADTVEQLILKPLGMDESYFLVPTEKKDQLTQGYNNSQPVLMWESNIFQPAGGLFSTAQNMMTFLEAQLHLFDSPLHNEIIEAQQRQFEMKDQSLGLGWFMDYKTGLVWHNGKTGGFSSFMGFLPENKQGFVLLTNSNISLDPLAEEIVKSL